MDIEANKENPVSPSSVYSMTEQMLYKLAALDASVQSGFRRIDEKMDRFQADLHNGQIATNDRINALDKEMTESFTRKRQRLDELDKVVQRVAIEAEDRSRRHCEDINHRVGKVEEWQKILTARMTIIGGGILAVWTFVAPAIRTAFGMGS